jgi:hypothetical protein
VREPTRRGAGGAPWALVTQHRRGKSIFAERHPPDDARERIRRRHTIAAVLS